MSVNAFYSAYNATQNALGDPRGDARKREEEDMRNAMLQRQMQMKEYEFSQAQAEAQRAERQRQLEEARINNRAKFIGGGMYGNNAPAMTRPAMANPSVGGAPVTPMAQGESFVDPATGQEGSSYTATAQSRGPMASQEDLMDFEMKDAWDRGDLGYFDTLAKARRESMSAEELAGRQQIAVAAGQILRMPAEQRAAAVLQALQQYGIDPSMTKVDDYVNDPIKLESALKFEIMRANPEKAAEENIRVQGTFDQFRPFERQDFGGSIAPFNPRTGEFGAGTKVTVSPNTAATTSTQIQLARMNNEARRRIALIQASTTMSEGAKNRAIKQEELGIRRREAEMGMPQGAPLASQGQVGSGIQWDDEEPQQ